MQNATNNTVNATATANVNTPALPNALGQFALYAQKQASLAAQNAQRLANATYTLLKPSNANLHRTPAKGNTQAQTNANYAAAILLQVYPLVASSGLTPAQTTQVQQNLLASIYNLQGVANLPASKIAVAQVLPPIAK
jgi:hypothetical protein